TYGLAVESEESPNKDVLWRLNCDDAVPLLFTALALGVNIMGGRDADARRAAECALGRMRGDVIEFKNVGGADEVAGAALTWFDAASGSANGFSAASVGRMKCNAQSSALLPVYQFMHVK